MLEAMDISSYLPGIRHVTAGGESGDEARDCDLKWFIDLQRQCQSAHVPFWFKQTGAKFVNEKGLLVSIARMNQQRLADSYQRSFS
jgi:protein gp37